MPLGDDRLEGNGSSREHPGALERRIVFAHPADVAAADQTAAGLAPATVRLRGLVPSGRLYVVRAAEARGIRFGFELDRLADHVIRLVPPTALGGGTSLS